MKYIATIRGVREIGIEGAAAPEPWEAVLSPLGLEPALTDGRVGVLLNTLSARWMGIRFREAIIAVDVFAQRDGERVRAVYLDLAFQSLRLFALAERRRFRTPFVHAGIETSVDPGRGFAVDVGGSLIYSAQRSADPRVGEREDQEWEVPIYFSSPRGAGVGMRDMFYAWVSRNAEILPFDSAVDGFGLGGGDAFAALNRLRASGFEPLRWRVCADSMHGRSGSEREGVG